MRRPGISGGSAGPVFGYVIAGEYEWAIDDQPARRLKAVDSINQPAKAGRNWAEDRRRYLAFFGCWPGMQ
jgi:hypothetical protein